MANYQEIYVTLFQQITAAINELQKVQRKIEEMCLSSVPTNTGSIEIAEREKQVHNRDKILQSLYYGELCPVEQYRPIIEHQVMAVAAYVRNKIQKAIESGFYNPDSKVQVYGNYFMGVLGRNQTQKSYCEYTKNVG